MQLPLSQLSTQPSGSMHGSSMHDAPDGPHCSMQFDPGGQLSVHGAGQSAMQVVDVHMKSHGAGPEHRQPEPEQSDALPPLPAPAGPKPILPHAARAENASAMR